MTLPALPWTRWDGLRALVDALGAEECRYVGGCVRDALLNVAAQDIDIATRHAPDAVMRTLNNAGIRTIPTGLDHGTVTALLPEASVEITTLRRDVATDGRHATIAFTDDWREDAARRDFTINALYAHPGTLAIDDYFGGLDDLKAGIVRFIGDARTRIAEDHLRILRYFRFEARFGNGAPDAEAVAACRDCAPTLMGLSRERIGQELRRLLALPRPAETVRRMADLGVLRVILPESGTDERDTLSRLIEAEDAAGIAPDAMRRLAALLPPRRDVAAQVAARLRLSNAQKKRLISAAEREAGDAANPRGLLFRLGRERAEDRLLLLGASVRPIAGWEPPAFAIDGRAVMAAGVEKGPAIAAILHRVQARWIDEGFPGPDRTHAILREEVG
ncbi:CCA tRNA nucleotidyltransferase [uncultured Croceicoccus sp.]|uniref:CCA tRNA nucleotidyltransferase n=1 Tax=uncultured Croceicoccus sp. TaxID=1295329 RepID=UPI002617D5AB|nr:CCA tRNA nucleotidyltransferase [uncultured Croceicoccus sp.]